MKNFTKTLLAAAALSLTVAPAFADTLAIDDATLCAPINMTVYFSDGETTLSQAAAAALHAEATDIGQCAITSVKAMTTSTDGGETLSQARSASVLAALESLGVTTSEATTHTASAPQGRFISTSRQVQLTMTTRPATLAS